MTVLIKYTGVKSNSMAKGIIIIQLNALPYPQDTYHMLHVTLHFN